MRSNGIKTVNKLKTEKLFTHNVKLILFRTASVFLVFSPLDSFQLLRMQKA